MPIEFHDIDTTEEGRLEHARWLARMTRGEVHQYAERKMMPTDYMVRAWKAARKLLRGRRVQDGPVIQTAVKYVVTAEDVDDALYNRK